MSEPFQVIRGYNLAPDFEGVVVNVSVMVVTKKGTEERDLTDKFSFAKNDALLGAAALSQRVLQLSLEEAQKRGIL